CGQAGLKVSVQERRQRQSLATNAHRLALREQDGDDCTVCTGMNLLNECAVARKLPSCRRPSLVYVSRYCRNRSAASFIMGFLNEYAAFFRQFRHNFYHTGAILPSSANLGRVVSRTMLGRRAPLRLLEVGPGTGS